MPESVSTTHWLLVLGSNVDASGRLRAARAALSQLGEVIGVSDERASADVAGGRLSYLNQLLELRGDLDADRLRAALKSIEAAQGRSAERMSKGLCDLDIDLLGRLDDQGEVHWLASKPRCIPAVQALLQARFGDALLG